MRQSGYSNINGNNIGHIYHIHEHKYERINNNNNIVNKDNTNSLLRNSHLSPISNR